MAKIESDEFVTEHCVEGGLALSYEITRKLHEERTEYQHIAIYESKQFGHVMAIDGFFQLTTRDNFLYHEMMAHPALFTHARPEHIAIIGGGDCGTLREVLKHSVVKKAWQIEIDERVTRLAEEYFPELCVSNTDERAEFYFGDGIAWLSEAKPESLDVIIVDSTDPIGPAKGLFSESFYCSCKQALRPGGLVVQQSESPLLHKETILIPMHQAMLAAGLDSTKTLYFPQSCYPSGWWTCTMGAKDCDLTHPRLDAIDNRPFKTTYYNRAIHQGALADPQFMLDAITALQYQ